ncbi:MAG: hypothetical protein IKW74_00720 [Thermoguttaceae bacterium]|nr:hypothetical protein [Thermoguttaceae bacterium]
MKSRIELSLRISKCECRGGPVMLPSVTLPPVAFPIETFLYFRFLYLEMKAKIC